MAALFENLGLLPELMQAVEKMGFTQPTSIQQAAIPVLLEGRNVVGQAQTGTGKTAAFVLPMLQNLLSNADEKKGVVRALVLAPTRELAIQVAEAASRMAQSSPMKVMAVYGGQSYTVQIRQIRRGVDVVVGTPGRLLDLIRQEVLDLSNVRYMVLDEADEMLEMGFIEDVETILSQVTSERQIALFSATLPEAIRRLAERYVSNPERIVINPQRVTVAEIEQRYVRVREENKFDALTRLLEVEEVKSALIFARTKMRAQELADQLIEQGYPAESLHGDLSQARREYVLTRFRQRTITMLVATDVAARGLDIENVSHVINYDIPGDAEDYVHRIGRTGRAGRKGVSITFMHPREKRRLGEIESYTHQKLQEISVPTREEIQARRDDRFIQRLYELLIGESGSREQEMVLKLVEMGVDMSDIAAAAIRMARASEIALPTKDITEPVEKSSWRERRSQPAEEGPARSGKNGRPAKPFISDKPWTPKGEQQTGMVRLKMNLGVAQGLRPGDVVGAIASEAGIPGKAIGEIDIQQNHTFVDVSEQHVRRVLKASTGQYRLRGKPVMMTLAN